MKTHGSATTFQVSNLDASLKFYTEKLGFSEQFRFGDYAGVEYEGVQIHLSGSQATNKRQVGQGGIYIFCDGVDSYYAEVTAKGVTIQAPPKDHANGMRDLVIEDPDGNLLGVGEESKKGS